MLLQLITLLCGAKQHYREYKSNVTKSPQELVAAKEEDQTRKPEIPGLAWQLNMLPALKAA